MGKLYEIQTEYTLKEMRKFSLTLLFRWKGWIAYALISLMVLVDAFLVKEWFYIVFVLVMPWVMILSTFLGSKKIYESNKAMQNAVVTYEFYPDSIVQNTAVSTYTIDHDKIARMIETKTHFYVMVSQNQGITLPKEKMSEELIHYLHELQKVLKSDK